MDSIAKKISYSFNYKSPETDIREILDELSSSVLPEITLYAAQIKGPIEKEDLELPKGLPLILGKSEKGNITISISGEQLNVEKILDVNDSEDFIGVLKKLRGVADSLMSVLNEKISGLSINFCGIVSEGLIETDGNATSVLKNRFIKDSSNENGPFDLRLRFTYDLQKKYFVNLLLSNSRTNENLNKQIYFNVDINNRYLYNYVKTSSFDKTYEDELVTLMGEVLTTGMINFLKKEGDLYGSNNKSTDNNL